jgi:hypothetical protein
VDVRDPVPATALKLSSDRLLIVVAMIEFGVDEF